MRGLSLLDRYLCGAIARRALAVSLVVVLILELDSLPRLLQQASAVDRPVDLVARLMTTLLPEYVSTGLPFALFLAVATTFRALAIQSELDAMRASGISNNRLLRGPLMAGIVATIAMVALQGELQPAGQRSLDRLGGEIGAGLYGFAVKPGEPFITPGGTTILADHRSPGPAGVVGVLVVSRDSVFTAARGQLRADWKGALFLELHHGALVRRPGGTSAARTDFDKISIRIADPPPMPKRDRWKRMTFTSLAAKSKGDDGGPLLEAARRLTLALLCLIVPILGAALGIVPPRNTGAAGMAVGLIVLTVVVFLTDRIDRFAVAKALIGLAGMLAILLSFALRRFKHRLDPH